MLLLTTISGGVAANAADAKWSGSTEVAYVTDYLWRGQKLAPDSLQPSISAFYSDTVMIGAWGSYGLEKGPSGKYSETDLLATYSFSQEHFRLTVGGTLYRISDLADPQTGKPFNYYFESLASLALKVKFSPTLTFWREYGRVKTNYLEFSLSPSFELNKQTRLTFRPHVGVFENSNHYFGTDVSLAYEFNPNFYVRAFTTLIKNNYAVGRHERTSFGVATGSRW
jgi:hypothetical protein